MAIKPPKLATKKIIHIFLVVFFGGKKSQKSCKNATLQLFDVVAFFNCFLIKKSKKTKKLQSCKVACLQLFVFFLAPKKSTAKKNPPKNGN